MTQQGSPAGDLPSREARQAAAGNSGRAATHRIVVGVDGAPPSLVALTWALAEGALRRVPVHVLLAWSTPVALGMAPVALLADIDIEASARDQLDTILRQHGPASGDRPANSPVTSAVQEGGAAGVLLAAARQDASLLVVGTRGHGGFTGLLLGSVSQQCVEHGTCPVVVVRETSPILG